MVISLVPLVLVGLFTIGADAEKGYVGVKIGSHHDTEDAVIVHEVVTDSPAEKAGLMKGDQIVKLNGDDVIDVKAFVEKVRGKKPGDEIKLVVKRDGKEKEIKVKVGKLPDPDKD